jgi:hypothetical protein
MGNKEGLNFIEVLILASIALIMMAAIVYGTRWFSNATTPVEVIEPVPGVQCVKLVTSDGVAVDCWNKI